MKTCTKCGVEKTLDSFYKCKTFKDGLQYMCKACVKAYHKVYYQENKESHAAWMKAWQEAHKEEEAVRKKAYYEANREEVLAYGKVYRAKNKEARSAYVKAWRQANPEKIREKGRRRRAMKLEVNENYTKEDEAFTKNLFDHACFNCGSTENLTVDHYRPLIKGNALTLTNAIILCKSCNCSKGPKDPEQFFSEEQTMIIQEVFDRVEEQV
jgi:5-methylcytosine-specific restriction endonuclease McrA